MKANVILRMIRRLYASWKGCSYEETIMSWRAEHNHLVGVYHGEHLDAISAEADNFDTAVHILACTLIARSLSDGKGDHKFIRNLLVLLSTDWVGSVPFEEDEEILGELRLAYIDSLPSEPLE